MEQEINLQKYLDILLRWWWLAAVLAILFGGTVYVANLFETPLYQAKAGLVYLPTRTEISLGSDFDSSTGGDLPSSGTASVVMDTQQRRYATLISLVENLDIAKQVIDELGDELPDDYASPRTLVRAVHGEFLNVEGVGTSDTLQIVVRLDDPVLAATIANTWADIYEDYVNAIYSDAEYNPFDEISEQVAEAEVSFELAQAEYLTFLREEDKTSELERRIEENMNVILRLYEGRQLTYMDVITAQRSAQHALIDYSVVASTNTNLRVYNEQWNDFIKDYAQSYERRRLYRGVLDDAIVIRDQLLAGGEDSAATSALGLQALKSRVANIDTEFWFDRIEVQVDTLSDLYGDASLEQQLVDLNAIISTIGLEVERLDDEIVETEARILSGDVGGFMSTLSPESVAKTTEISKQALMGMSDWDGLLAYNDILESPFANEIARLEELIRINRAEWEDLTGRAAILEKQRDLKWTTYANLVTKQQEIEVASAAAGSDLIFAVRAIPSKNPISPNKTYNTAIGCGVGGMVGVFGGFLLDYLKFDSKPKFLWRQLRKKESRSS